MYPPIIRLGEKTDFRGCLEYIFKGRGIADAYYGYCDKVYRPAIISLLAILASIIIWLLYKRLRSPLILLLIFPFLAAIYASVSWSVYNKPTFLSQPDECLISTLVNPFESPPPTIISKIRTSFFGYKCRTPSTQPTASPTPPLVPVIITPPPTPTSPALPKRILKTAPLSSYQGYQYLFEWPTCDELEVYTVPPPVSDYCFNSPVRLIRQHFTSPSKRELVAESKNYPILFTILMAPPSTGKVLLNKFYEGTDAMSSLILDLETGQTSSLHDLMSQYGQNCVGFSFPASPPPRSSQSSYLFKCDTNSNSETLFSLSIIDNSVKPLTQTNHPQTFGCTEGMGIYPVYKYLSNQSVSLDICDKNASFSPIVVDNITHYRRPKINTLTINF